MARRFDQFYRTRRNDNLGDPDWHNRRWDDIDRRMHARELDASTIDRAVDTLEAAALARLNDQLTPIIAQAITRLHDFGLLFTATSHTEREIELGEMTLAIDEAMRLSYVATGFVIIRPTADLAIGMTARTLGYDIDTGILTVDVYSIIGSGTYSEWSIGVTGDPDLSHATRIDNPHETTAAQVGAYTTAEADAQLSGAIATEVTNRNAAILAAKTEIIGGAPIGLTTLDALAAAIGDQADFATQMTAELAARLDIDEPQTLSTAQKLALRAALGSVFWSTGDFKLTLKNVADPGWVMCNDGTIGSASSGATRANADCYDLFALLFSNIPDAYSPIYLSNGTGTSRAAQGSAGTAWGNNCRISLTRVLGRALAISGSGSGLTTRNLGQFVGAESHALSTGELALHSHPPAGANFASVNDGSNPICYTAGSPNNNLWSYQANTQNSGNSYAHNNMQPTSFMNIMICL